MRGDEVRDPVRQLVEGRISRREFVIRALALGLSASAVGSILAACGGEKSGVGKTSTSEGPVAGTAPAPSMPDYIPVHDKILAEPITDR